MSRASSVASIGVDFGTSNTVVAIADENGAVEAVRFDHDGTARNVFASALCFSKETAGKGLPPVAEGGPWAIERLQEGRGALRFIQSFKTFAASSAFDATMIFGQKFRFEDLLVAFLRTLSRHADTDLDLAGADVTIGRPVRFAGARADDALAMQRYRTAFDRLGATNARYVYEPVGAAFSFARALQGNATVLVADFGGGTSDFSVMRFSRSDGVLQATPLGHAGVGIAGDSFDARIVEHVVSPRLGKGSHYRSFGKTLAVPNRYYARLSRWNELAMMKGSADLKEMRALAATADKPDALHDFISLVEFDLGFALYRAVSAAKTALSQNEAVDFHFAEDEIDMSATITRRQFESWIAHDLARLADAVDQALDSAHIAPDAIDRVFLTGGTSFVPAVQAIFTERFGADKLSSADQFESIAYGLALIGQSPDPDQWTVAG